MRRIRGPIHFISKGKYQYLNRPIRVRLNPAQINTIRIRGAASFSDFLRRQYRWNGRTALTIEILLFRTSPVRGKMSDILRAYFGRGQRIRLTPFHFRQLHPMTGSASRIFKLHTIWSRPIPTYYLVNKILPATGGIVAFPSTASTRETPQRSNNASIKIDTLGRLRASVDPKQSNNKNTKSPRTKHKERAKTTPESYRLISTKMDN